MKTGTASGRIAPATSATARSGSPLLRLPRGGSQVTKALTTFASGRLGRERLHGKARHGEVPCLPRAQAHRERPLAVHSMRSDRFRAHRGSCRLSIGRMAGSANVAGSSMTFVRSHEHVPCPLRGTSVASGRFSFSEKRGWECPICRAHKQMQLSPSAQFIAHHHTTPERAAAYRLHGASGVDALNREQS
jgi:hypothetical protein